MHRGEAAGHVNVGDLERTVSAVGGTFALTYNGYTTQQIAWNADAATVQAALRRLNPGTAAASQQAVQIGGHRLRGVGDLFREQHRRKAIE